MPKVKTLDWLDELPAEETHRSEVVPAPQLKMAKGNERLDYFKSIEDEILNESMTVVRDTIRFREIDPNEEGIPDEWVKEVGLLEATRRHRVARLSHLPPKEAPIGIGVAKSVMVGIVKARATEKSGPKSLNVQTIIMSAPLPVFPEREVE